MQANKYFLAAIASACLLLASASSAQSTAWWHVSTSGQPASQAGYVDVANIRIVSPNIRRAWTTIVESNGAYPPGAAGYSIYLAEYDCHELRNRLLQFANYGTRDEVISSGTMTGDWYFATPGTTGASTLEFVCAPPGNREAAGTPTGTLTPRQHAVLYVFQ